MSNRMSYVIHRGPQALTIHRLRMAIGLVETCQLAWQPEKPEKAQKGEKKLVVLLMLLIRQLFSVPLRVLFDPLRRSEPSTTLLVHLSRGATPSTEIKIKIAFLV